MIAAGGRKGEIYSRLRDLRDRYAEAIRERYPPLERRVSGFNLEQLLPENNFNVARALVGTEGTCAITLEATLGLVEHPPYRATAVLGYPDVFRAADHIMQIREHEPNALEAIDEHVPANLRHKQQELEETPTCPTATAGCSSSSAARRRTKPTKRPNPFRPSWSSTTTLRT